MRYTASALALASLLCLPVGATFAQAQQDSTAAPAADNSGAMQNMHRMRPMSVDQQLDHMTKALNLTSDQQGQIKPLLEGRRQQMMSIHQDQTLSREDRMSKMETLDNDTHAKIAAVLNPDQKSKFEQMAQRREANRSEHMNGGMNGQGGGQPQQ
jgi:periplasmic protein CpxP/Spy